jgi:hypothetical protein
MTSLTEALGLGRLLRLSTVSSGSLAARYLRPTFPDSRSSCSFRVVSSDYSWGCWSAWCFGPGFRCRFGRCCWLLSLRAYSSVSALPATTGGRPGVTACLSGTNMAAANHSLQATSTRLRCEAWAVRMGVRLPCGSRRLVRVAVPEFKRYAVGT